MAQKFTCVLVCQISRTPVRTGSSANGRVAAAAPLAAQLRKDARATGYAPLITRAARIDAAIHAELGRPADAEASYLETIAQAGAAHDDQAAFDGWRGLVAMRAELARQIAAARFSGKTPW